MHFHRDLLLIADGYAREVLGVTPDDVFVGSPPLAFTFGLGGLAIFPLRFGAAAALLEQATPPNMIEIIQTYRATVCFTAPTPIASCSRPWTTGPTCRPARRRQRGRDAARPVYEEWIARTGKPMLDGIGATRCCTSSSPTVSMTTDPPARPPVSGYEARSSMTKGASGRAARWAVSPCAAPPAAATWPMRARRNTSRTAGT